MKRIETIFNEIIHSSLFLLTGPDIDLVGRILALCEAISNYDGDTAEIWYLGQYSYCCLSDFIAGAYWCLTDWHGGQASKSYLALCALGCIFDPGMSILEEDSPEYDAYLACCEWFETHK